MKHETSPEKHLTHHSIMVSIRSAFFIYVHSERNRKMSESMKLKVSSRKNKDGSEYFEGTVTLPVSNLSPARVQKSDGTTKFCTRSALVQAAKSAAKKLGCEVADAQPVKQAAKKTATKTATKKKPSVTNPPWLNS